MGAMSVTLIVLVAVFFALMGLYGLARPEQLVAPFGMAADRVDARSEVRAVYGGFGIAVAAVLGLAAADIGDIRFGACIAVGAALAGMAFGRLVSAVIERPRTFYPVWFYFLVEFVLAGLLFVAVWL